MHSISKRQPSEKEIKGNAKKYEAYREAWVRIKQAQENGFFLEAITIQESIISDRLISFLSRPGASNNYTQKRDRGSFVSFYQIIQCWRSELSAPLQSGAYVDLVDEVDQWRQMRNKAVHAIVKFDCSDDTQTVDTFLQRAKEVAEYGEQLAREVCKWQKATKGRS